jgi:CBS domain containing-hemolysin-like protein
MEKITGDLRLQKFQVKKDAMALVTKEDGTVL